MVQLEINGNSMSNQAIQEAFVKVQQEHRTNDDVKCSRCCNAIAIDDDIDDDGSDNINITDEIETRDVNFDLDQVDWLVQTIHSKKENDTRQSGWKAIHIVNCSGLVNDAILACTTATNVQCISLQQPIINPQTMFCLTYGLKYNHQLQRLKLCIPFDVSSSRNLSTAIARNTWLQELDLEGSTFGDASSNTDGATTTSSSSMIMNISFGLRLNQHLQTLILNSCYLQDVHIHSILMALEGHTTLRKLSLQKNACHTQGMTAVATLLHDNYIQELDLSFLIRQPKKKQTQQEDGEEKDDTKEEGDVMKDTHDDGESTTTEIDDKKPTEDAESNKENNETKQEDDDPKDNNDNCTDNAETQVRNTSLKLLLLAGNGLNDDFLQSMLSIFGPSSQLEELNLFGNRLTSNGIKNLLLKQKLKQLKNLKRIYLGHNSDFHPLDIKYDLINALKNNYSLEQISINSLLHQDPELTALQEQLNHYTRMNESGRKIMSCFEEEIATKESDSVDEMVCNNGTTRSDNEKKRVPMGLWPLILERANRMHQQLDENKKDCDDLQDNFYSSSVSSYAADAIFCLLHGPVVFENYHLTPSKENLSTKKKSVSAAPPSEEISPVSSSTPPPAAAAAAAAATSTDDSNEGCIIT